MNLAQHLEKAARYEALMARLDVVRDFELWIWVAMSSGTNVLNAALHAAGITSDRACYPVRPNRYMVPGANPGTWTQEEGPLGDVLHVDVPAIEAALPPALERACEALRVIDDARDPCVRGPREITPELAEACAAAYRDCVKATKPILEGRLGGAR
ncbi:MAG TPA: hypothetical protein QF804_05800 [Rhodospirillales bacterium]|jgi:hypothetical protein|nr:hypothetical protein [Rhodospirillales bacterium]HJO69179.1 hypothetical protein [Rhodospirillales bacterium]